MKPGKKPGKKRAKDVRLPAKVYNVEITDAEAPAGNVQATPGARTVFAHWHSVLVFVGRKPMPVVHVTQRVLRKETAAPTCVSRAIFARAMRQETKPARDVRLTVKA